MSIVASLPTKDLRLLVKTEGTETKGLKKADLEKILNGLKEKKLTKLMKEAGVEAPAVPEVPAFDAYASLDDDLNSLEKQFDFASMSLDKNESRISTGMLQYDLILGGGLVGGGWYTFFGPEQSCKSTTAMTVLAAIMKNQNFKGRGFLFDYEGSTDATYVENIMKAMGVKGDITDVFGLRDNEGEYMKLPRVRMYAPQSGEAFFDYVHKLIKKLPDKIKIGDGYYFVYDNTRENQKLCKGLYDKKYFKKYNKFKIAAEDGNPQAIILCDSFPAMLPEASDNDEDSNALALQARMFSDGMKRVKGAFRRKRLIVLGVNQLRLRPMVKYGCLHGSVKVPMVDGRTLTMRQIVDGNIEGEVWSYNEQTKEIEAKRIMDWHYNGEVEQKSDWVKIRSRCNTQGGFATVTVTQDHEVLTQHGWTKAKDLVVGDTVYTRYESTLNGTLGEFMSGVLSADSALVKDCATKAHFRLRDEQNREYRDWKAEKLQAFDFTEWDGNCLASTRTFELSVQKNLNADRDPTKFKHTALSLAVMYMDDGTFDDGIRQRASISYKRFKDDKSKMQEIADIYREFGMDPNITSDGSLQFTKDDSALLFELISTFVPECMRYKLPSEMHSHFEEFDLQYTPASKSAGMEIVELGEGTDTQMRNTGKYDISVKDNKNYLVGGAENGIIVHNSPEYEPCGEALKFFSDVRLRNSPVSIPHGKGQLEEEPSIIVDGGTDQYRYIKTKAHKNKLSTPYLDATTRLCIKNANGDATGFCHTWDTYQYLLATGQVGGNRAKMKFDKDLKMPLAGVKGLTWMEFKMLVEGTGAEIKKLCKDLGIKPVKIRQWAFKQCASGKGPRLHHDHMRSKSIVKNNKSKASDSSDSSDEFD